MKRTLLVITAMLILMSAYGVGAKQFVIGTYTQYMLRRANPPQQIISELGTKLQDAGYNTALYSMGNEEPAAGRLQIALNELSRRGISSSLDDWAMQDNGVVGVTVMAHGNYMKMEAEYILNYQNGVFTPDVLPRDDSANDALNTVFRHETGRRSDYNDKLYSNGYAWICDEKNNDRAGIALTEPRFRWKPDDRRISRVICYDLRFLPSIKGDRLYMVVALDWSDLPSDAKVADIALTGLKNSALDMRQYEFGVYGDDAYMQMELKSMYPELYGTTIFNRKYPGIRRDPVTGYAMFEYYVDIPKPDSPLFKELIRIDFFNHINPRIYWHGKGKLSIDYLEFEDEIYRALSGDTPNHPMLQGMLSRVEQIDRLNNASSLLFYYGKDEPFQGQFATYNQLQRHLGKTGKKLIAAIHLEGTKIKKPNGHADYFHAGQFMKYSKPEIMMLDAYPLQEWGAGAGSLIRWNESSNHANFIQNKLETTLIANYHKLTAAINHDKDLKDTMLFFVPQIFGEKYEPVESGEWRFVMPPRAMLKCLKLMPLCYAPDGIVDYALTSDRLPLYPHGNRKYNRVSPLLHDADYANLRALPGEVSYQYITEANAKIRVYGPIVKDLTWVEADSVMVNGTHPKIDLRRFKLSSLQVQKSGVGPYEGYVQCGWYLDAKGMPSFMLVNRRAVYQKPDSPSIIPMDVDNYFTDATPQTLRFVLDKKTDAEYALYDPYSQSYYYPSNGVIDISLAAGDGILLQMIALPPRVNGFITNPDGDTVISGNISVAPKQTFRLPTESRSLIAPNTTIVVGKNATLEMRGAASFGSNVRIILQPGAKLRLDPTNAILAHDTIIESRQRPSWLQRLFGKKY